MKILSLKLVSLFTFISFFAFSKDDIYKITLKNEKIELSKFKFSINEVLDQRMNKILIGSVQRGLNNRRCPAEFENNLAQEFGTLIYNSSLHGNGENPITLIINSIWVDERTSAMKELGLVDLEFYIAQKTANGYLILNEQEISISQSVLDATAGHDKRIARALKEGLENFMKINSTEYLNITYEEKKYNVDSTILKCKCIKKGIYNTFNDLYNNSPLEKKAFFDSVNYNTDNALVIDKLFKTKDFRKFFAFSDGKKIYFNSLSYGNYRASEKGSGYQFGKGKLDGPFYVIEDEIPDLMAQAVGAAGFGILGYLMTSNAKIQAYSFVDIRNGAILPIKKNFIEASLKEFPTLLEKFNKSKPSQLKDIKYLVGYIKEINQILRK